MTKLEIRQTSRPEDKEAAVDIARSLPDYFTELGLERIAEDLEKYMLFGFFDGDAMVAFITVHETDERCVDISWLATRKEYQGQGIGRKLVYAALEPYEERGFELCALQAPVETEPGEDFSATKKFYERLGFQTLYIIDPYPAWGPDDACRVMAARLPLKRG
jgi:ribosomal protein S18 acetylase RimI-like enzyme